MSTLVQDLRYAARQLARAPGFTAVAIATLALGIGANTALFTLVDAVLFRPLSGVRGADRLVWVAPMTARGGHPTNMSYLDYVDYRDHTNVFSELAALDQAQFSISGGGSGVPERVRGQIVTGNFFSVLGTSMALGRGFVAEEDRTPNTHPVVVISYDLWQRRFAGDRSVVGSTLVLNGGPFTIVGIAPEHFNGPDHGERRDVWVPTMMASRVYPLWPNMLSQRQSWWLKGIGRLKPGVAPTQADAAVRTVAAE